MKIIKYISFTLMFLLNLAILYSFKISLFRHFDGEETGPELADSKFENAREIYISYYLFIMIIMLIILFFSAKKIKSSPLTSFCLLIIPVLYMIVDVFFVRIF